MADLRVPPPSSPIVPRQTTALARLDASSAAQRAFFQTAAGGEPPAQPPAPSAKVEAGEAPQRLLRPGSLLDIKV